MFVVRGSLRLENEALGVAAGWSTGSRLHAIK
jgi:hypothetical protein